MKKPTSGADAAPFMSPTGSPTRIGACPDDTDAAADRVTPEGDGDGDGMGGGAAWGAAPSWRDAWARPAQAGPDASRTPESASKPDALSLGSAPTNDVFAMPVGMAPAAFDPPRGASFLGAPASAAQAPASQNALQAADPQFGPPVVNPFGLTDAGSFASPTLADIDGDGDLDALVGNSSGITQFFRNTGSAGPPVFVLESGNFGLTDIGKFASPTLVDIDSDGDLDAFVGEEQGSTVFFRNTGTANAPVFVRQAGSLGLDDAGYIARPTFADIDGDGDLDAFVGEQYGSTLFFRNTGSDTAPAFVRQAGNFGLPDSGSYASPTLVDIDGDGDLDAFVGESYGNTLFYRNTGTATAAVFAPKSAAFGLSDVGSWASPTFADIDGDGDLDGFVGGADGKVRFFANNAVVLTAPGPISYTDTAFNDGFATASRTLTARGDNGTLVLTFGISGGTDNGSTVSMASAYGVLTVSKASGAASFAPDDAAIEALGTAASVVFTLTASNGIKTGSQALTINLVQSGVTETPGNDTLAGTAGPDRFDALAGDDSIAGSGGNDTLVGSAGNDTLNGGAGNDSMVGGTGNDTYVVDSTTDVVSETVTSATEIDTVSSSIGWTLGANLENLRLGGGNAINGTGNTLANVITGNSAGNQLGGLGGNDSLNGGDGNDTISGGDGNDLLDGGAGNDSMTGGAGNDSYVVQSIDDRTIEASGGGTADSVSASLSWTLAAEVERLVLTGSAATSGSGNALSNTLTGNTAANTLSGGDGNDTINGGDGNDTIGGGNGNDLLDGGSGNDSLTGGAGNDSYVVQSSGDRTVEAGGGGTADSVSASLNWTLAAEVERLVLTGSSAINGSGNTLANTITGNTAANTLTGGDGNDTLDGGNGNDLLDGGNGNDSLTGGAGNDSYVVQSIGDRTVEAGGGGTADSVSASLNWTLAAEVERLVLTGSSAINGSGNTLANTITGNTAANTLSGGDGNDTLSGGDGDDRLEGGNGNDSMNGGAGLDTFRFSSALNANGNVDAIAAFSAADDSLQLENGIFAKLTSTGTLTAAFFHASITGVAADSNDYINYETDTGKLFYDADGNGSGAAVLFATLSGAPALSNLDIFVT